MKIEVSEFYKQKGYTSCSTQNDGVDGRKCIRLYGPNGMRKHMLYSKYVYTSYYKCDIPDGDEVDHINGNKFDDRLENLQVISGVYNKQKDHPKKEMVILKCSNPNCGKEFLFLKRNLSTHPNPCCCKKCAYHKQKLLSVTSPNNKINNLNLESIKKDIEDGLKQSEIAAKHNVSVSTLKRFIWSHGIYMGKRKPSRQKI